MTEQTWYLNLPPLAVADVRRSPSANRTWREAVTVVPHEEYGRLPIREDIIPVTLPDDYVGEFEVHLLAEDGTRLVVVEGRRLRSLEESE